MPASTSRPYNIFTEYEKILEAAWEDSLGESQATEIPAYRVMALPLALVSLYSLVKEPTRREDTAKNPAAAARATIAALHRPP